MYNILMMLGADDCDYHGSGSGCGGGSGSAYIPEDAGTPDEDGGPTDAGPSAEEVDAGELVAIEGEEDVDVEVMGSSCLGCNTSGLVGTGLVTAVVLLAVLIAGRRRR